MVNNRDFYINKLYKSYPILSQIDNNYHGIIRHKAIFKKIIAGQYLPTQNNECLGFLFVISGSIKIQKLNEKGEETNLYNLESGQLCHEALSCFMDCTTLSILGKAVVDAEICIIPFEIVNRYLLHDTLFLQYMYKDLYSKFKIIINTKEEIKHESLKNRLIKVLIDKNSRNIYLTHNDLAFELDSAREVISRKLKELEKMGYLKLSRGNIQIERNLNELLE